jgi:hypothetical protein
MNIIPTRLAFLRALDTPKGMSMAAATAQWCDFTMCRDAGLCTNGLKENISLTAKGRAALRGGLTPMTWRRWAFLNKCGGPGEGVSFYDIMRAPNRNQLIDWTCEGQAEGWLTGEIWNHNIERGWAPDNQHAKLTLVG